MTGVTNAPVELPDSGEHPVFYVPEVLRAELAAAKRARTTRIVSLLISVAITAALWWFYREQYGATDWWWLAIMLAIPVGLLIWAIVTEVRTRRELKHLLEGLALAVDRAGVRTASGALAWADVAAVDAVQRFGRPRQLRVHAADGRVETFPLRALSDAPAALDAAVRALSGGRRRIDFSRLGV